MKLNGASGFRVDITDVGVKKHAHQLNSAQSQTTIMKLTHKLIAQLCALFVLAIGLAEGQQTASAALTGIVSSGQQKRMEGVLVTAKKAGGTLSVTVVSNQNGRYAFPATKLDPGKYELSIRAAGYELPTEITADVANDRQIYLNINLQKAQDLAAQLVSAEWLISAPGTQAQKQKLYRCANCHSLFPVMRSKYDSSSWDSVLARMETFVPPSVVNDPVLSPIPVKHRADPEFDEYLASINLSQGSTWNFPLHSFARPKGEATKALITEYDLPPGSLPHDAVPGTDGMIWFNDFQRPIIGRLNPRTGEVKQWTMPLPRPQNPQGSLALAVDKKGNIWVPRFFQGCTVTKFNPRTEQFKSWTVPAGYNNAHARCGHIALGSPDGLIWLSDSENRRMFQFDPKTGKFVAHDSFPGYKGSTASPTFDSNDENGGSHRTYEIARDSIGNGYFADIGGSTIGRVDAKTGEVKLYPTPTPKSGPRRCFMDKQDKLWFGENYASKLGVFDTKREVIEEFVPPVPWNGAYPAVEDKNGNVWTAGMSTDYILRFDPQSKTFVSYLLPSPNANVRYLDVDNSSNPPKIWVPEVHTGRIASLEVIETIH